jgi:hypothetical protein
MDKVKAAVQGADIKVKIGAAAVLVLLIALITWLVWPLSCASKKSCQELQVGLLPLCPRLSMKAVPRRSTMCISNRSSPV